MKRHCRQPTVLRGALAASGRAGMTSVPCAGGWWLEAAGLDAAIATNLRELGFDL